jgi:hypothetical protein
MWIELRWALLLALALALATFYGHELLSYIDTSCKLQVHE